MYHLTGSSVPGIACKLVVTHESIYNRDLIFGKNISQIMLNYEVHNTPGCKIVSRQKYEDSKKISGCQALEGKCEMTRTQDFCK